MAKKIQYPTDEWLEKYVTTQNVSLEDAECAWWDMQIDKGNPTPYDLTEEEEKNVKAVTKGMAKSQKAVNAYGQKVKRERKPNENKREIIAVLAEALAVYENCTITNIERSVDFTIGDKHYTVNLTEHRAKKEG